MKQLFIAGLAGVVFIASSCNESNETKKEQNTANTEQVQEVETPAADNSMPDSMYIAFYNLDNYTPEQVKEHREMQKQYADGKLHGYYPEASTRLLTEDDIKYLTEWGHKVMLNEIYARHGKVFTTQDLIDHFNTQTWYKGDKTKVTDLLTDIEQQNVEFLNNHPAEHISPSM